jgi:hypothetical protein
MSVGTLKLKERQALCLRIDAEQIQPVLEGDFEDMELCGLLLGPMERCPKLPVERQGSRQGSDDACRRSPIPVLYLLYRDQMSSSSIVSEWAHWIPALIMEALEASWFRRASTIMTC